MNPFLFTLYLSGFIFLIFKLPVFKKTEIKSIYLVLIFAIKIGAGIGVNNYYSKNYDDKYSDIYKYFNDGITLSKIGKESPTSFVSLFIKGNEQQTQTAPNHLKLKNWNNHTEEYLKTINYKDSNFFNSQRTLIRINAIIGLISNGFLPIHTLFFCFFSFLGICIIYANFQSFFLVPKWLSTILLFLTPSVLIWSSTLFKESLIILGLGLYLAGLFENKSRIKKIIYLIFSIGILAPTAIHVFLILLLVTLLFYTFQKNRKYTLVIVLIGLGLFLLSTQTKFNPLQLVASKMNQQHKIGRGGYYFLNKKTKEELFITEQELETVQPQQKLYNGVKSRIYLLPSTILVAKYKNGKIIPPFETLNEAAGEYYMKLHYKKAESYLPSNELEPTLKSFVLFFPKAIKNTFLEPIPNKIQDKRWIFFLENILILLLFLYSFVKSSFKNETQLFLLICAFALLLLIAYTSPIAGNIVRYKSSAIILILIAGLSSSPYKLPKSFKERQQ